MEKIVKKIGKALFITTYLLLLLFFIWQILLRPLYPVSTDVAQRLKSPDGTKTAILIRRNASHLRLAVKVKEGSKTKTLHWSRNFEPDLKSDWNEKNIWSDDSSFLALTVDDVQNNNEKYMWAYDFIDRREYNDKDTIIKIMNSRSKIPPFALSEH
jgi:hypothetical protein